MKFKEDELCQVIELIQCLYFWFGLQIELSEVEYIVFDVIVCKDNECWLVELNQEVMLCLCVNVIYVGMVCCVDSSVDNIFMCNQLQEVCWFIKSLQSCNEMLMKVVIQIVEYQCGFFDYGEEVMKLLVLYDIVEVVGMYELIILWVIMQKYMYMLCGIFELKYFFLSYVSIVEGGECLFIVICVIIKKLVVVENVKKLLSDSKIVGLLEVQGI